MKKMSSYLLSGVGFGSFSYLLVLLLHVQTEFPTSKNILSIFMVSALVGVWSMIFKKENWNFLGQLLMHFVGTFALMVALMLMNGWPLTPLFGVLFLGIYGLVWGVVIFQQHMIASKMNTLLEKKQ